MVTAKRLEVLVVASALLAGCGSGSMSMDGGGDASATDVARDVAADTVDGGARDVVVVDADATSPDASDVVIDTPRDAAVTDAVDATAVDAVDAVDVSAVDVSAVDVVDVVDANPCGSGSLCGGVCVDTQTEPTHCGGCFNDCTTLAEVDPNAVTCQAGVCQLAGACSAGFDDCNADPSDGCEVSLSSVSNCGACGRACSAPANATPVCNGSCTFACNQGYQAVGSVCVAPPRQIAPLSTSTVTSLRPRLQWVLGDGDEAVHVEICADRACSLVITSFDSAGTSGTPSIDLPHGQAFWRVTAIAGGVAQPSIASPVWQFSVGVRTAPISTSWGSTLDVNGDGYADVAAGAPRYSSYVGRVEEFNGGQYGVTALTLQINSPLTTDARFGEAIASAGDLNGDGFGDFVVGAKNAASSRGQVFVYFGSATGLSATPSKTLSGRMVGGTFGQAVAAIGDLNADGYADLAVGSPGINNTVGEVDVYLGSSTGLGDAPSIILAGPGSPGDNFGAYVAGVGDLNGDGHPDMAVGGLSAASAAGRVWVFMGSASGFDASPNVTINAQDTGGAQLFGTLAGPGDVNGDGYSDLIVGAQNALSGAGLVYVFPGSATGVATTASQTLNPQSSYFGANVSFAGDVNADGYDDVVATAAGTNRVYLYLGSSTGLPTTASQVLTDIYGTNTGFGQGVSGAGDTNADGFADIVVGANESNSNAGAMYVFFGKQTGLGTLPASSTGGPPAGGLGFSVATRGRAVGHRVRCARTS